MILGVWGDMQTILQLIFFLGAFFYIPAVVIFIGPIWEENEDKVVRFVLGALILLGGFGIYKLGVIFNIWQIAPY